MFFRVASKLCMGILFLHLVHPHKIFIFICQKPGLTLSPLLSFLSDLMTPVHAIFISSMVLAIPERLGEMTQSVILLLCKYEDLSSIPWASVKIPAAGIHGCPQGTGETESRGSMRLISPSFQSTRREPGSKEADAVVRMTPKIVTSIHAFRSLHVYLYTHAHTLHEHAYITIFPLKISQNLSVLGSWGQSFWALVTYANGLRYGWWVGEDSLLFYI